MKFATFCLRSRSCHQSILVFLALGMSLGAGLSSYVHAQGPDPVGAYFAVAIPKPPEQTSININGLSIVTDAQRHVVDAWAVGWASRTDRPKVSGWLYDHLGAIDPLQPGRTYDALDPALGLVFPPSWMPNAVGSSFVRINSNGRLVGSIIDPNDNRAGFYCDLFAMDGSGNPLPRELNPVPQLGPTGSSYARSVNEFGDILIVPHSQVGVPSMIFNPDTGEAFEIPDAKEGREFNDLRQVVGYNEDHAIRFTPIGSMGYGLTEVFTETTRFANLGINNAGEFTATKYVSKGKNKGRYAARFNAAGIIDWEAPYVGSHARTINNSGDLVWGEWSGSIMPDIMRFYDSSRNQNYLASDLQGEPDPVFQATVTNLLFMTDRDDSGLPWFIGRADVDNDGTYDTTFLLVPPMVGPGITVTPTSGLVTTEDGGSDSFDVVLKTQPTADVTIPISSSDLTEGTVDVASLTFTPANWDIPQTVTITGVNDAIEDGDVVYTIFTDAAVSTDLAYHGLNADDVQVTNLDNDGPLTYHSEDTPLSIPDNNPGGESSDIVVSDNIQIAGLTVTLDISHSRPSDLVVYLFGPNDAPPVELSTFSGDNDVPAFNGTSTFGTWTLKVVDTTRRRTGTLNSWSITVDRP